MAEIKTKRIHVNLNEYAEQVEILANKLLDLADKCREGYDVTLSFTAGQKETPSE